MSKADRKQVEFLAEEYLRLARAHGRLRRHHMECDEVSYALDHLRQADEVLDFLNRSGRDPYTTLRDVNELLRHAGSGLSAFETLLGDTGFSELLDDHLDTLMRALSAEALPGGEAELLDALGFPNLARTIQARTDLLGAEWRNGSARGGPVAHEYRRAPVSQGLKFARDSIEKHRAERERHDENDGETQSPTKAPEKQRRWWKVLGQIVQGAAIAGADIGLAIGVLHVPIPAGGETFGVVMSVTAGAGTVMNGVGDLWGE